MFLRRNSKGNNQRGDTIVEVMIVLAVLGLAISISYATANRSLLNARQAQESSEATELAQTQVEDLRILAPNTGDDASNNNIFTKVATFCVHNPILNPPDPMNPPITPYNNSPLIAVTDPASCHYGASNLYKVLVYNCDILTSEAVCAGLGSSNTFIVQVSWPDVISSDTDFVTLSYRVHQVGP